MVYWNFWGLDAPNITIHSMNSKINRTPLQPTQMISTLWFASQEAKTNLFCCHERRCMMSSIVHRLKNVTEKWKQRRPILKAWNRRAWHLQARPFFSQNSFTHFFSIGKKVEEKNQYNHITAVKDVPHLTSEQNYNRIQINKNQIVIYSKRKPTHSLNKLLSFITYLPKTLKLIFFRSNEYQLIQTNFHYCLILF